MTPSPIPTLSRRLLQILCLATLLFCTVCVHAGDAPSAIRRVTLTDGVRLLLKPETETDGLVITVFVREEAPSNGEEAAIRSMVNAALFYGSEQRSFEAVSASVARTGGVLLTRQTPDYVAVTCVTTNSQAREAIFLITEAIKNADYSPDALERARQTLLRQRTERASDPFLGVYDSLTRTLQGRIEPNPVELRHVTQAQATAYFHSHFVPGRTVAVVAGRFDSDAVQKTFDNYLFDYERPTPPFPSSHHSRPTLDGSTPTLTSTTTGAASYALIGAQSPPITHPDYPAFAVLASLLGEGHASRMFREIREKSGFGYNVGASFRAEEDNPLVAYLEWEASPGPGSHALTPDAALKLITEQLDNLTSHPPTESELQRARNFAIGQYLIRHERLQERAFLPGWYEVMGLGYDFDTDLPHRLAAVTQADITRVIKTYLAQRLSALGVQKTGDRDSGIGVRK